MSEAPAEDSDTTATETIVDPAGAATRGPGSSLIRSSMVNSSLTLVSRFMGFLRDLVLTARLGASATPAADAFVTALAFPNLFRRIFGEGAFAAAFQPAYVRALAQEGKAAADKLAEEAMAGLALMTVLLTVACQLAMPWLMVLINPGYLHDPVKFKLAVVLTQLTMPYLPCMAVYAHLSGVLNSHGRFIVSGIAPVLLNLVMLLFVLPQPDPIQAAWWASAGVVAAGVFQVGLLWWGVRRSGSHVRWVWPTLNPPIRALIAKAVPGALSASAFQINIFISGILASQVNGARMWLNVADRLYQLPVGMVGVAIGVALLPRLSRAVHTGDHADASGAMDEAVTFAMALTLPAAAAMLAMPYFMIDGLYTRGLFHDAPQTAAVLFQYGWGAPAFVLMQIINRAFYARQDTKTPMRVALVQVAVNVGLGLVLFALIKAPGIAAATSLASWLSVAQMALILRRRGHYWPSMQAWSKLLRALAASAGLGVALAAASHWRPQIEHALRWAAFGPLHPKEAALALATAGALPLYAALLIGLGGVTPAELRRALRRR